MRLCRSWLFALLLAASPSIALAEADSKLRTARELLLDPAGHQGFFERIRPLIVEGYEFYGLASYYNNLNFFITEDGDLQAVKPGQQLSLKPGQWFIAKGRHNVLAMRWPGATIAVAEQRFDLRSLPAGAGDAKVIVVPKPQLSTVAPELDQLRYSHLGALLGGLARVIEWSLMAIHGFGVTNWGLVIIVFGVLLKIVLLPLSIITARFQRQVSQVTTQLAPRLAEIKANNNGAEVHTRVIAAHKALGVSPFYTLKPMMTGLVQLPILVAIFNALGEMPQLAGARFLWIGDLTQPDVIFSLPGALPLFGDKVSLLPFVMTAVTVLSTIIFQNPHALSGEMNSTKRNLYLMAAVFLILFYPFPAGMVLFWAVANILQTMQQQIVKL